MPTEEVDDRQLEDLMIKTFENRAIGKNALEEKGGGEGNF